jgi:hypothetical protein
VALGLCEGWLRGRLPIYDCGYLPDQRFRLDNESRSAAGAAWILWVRYAADGIGLHLAGSHRSDRGSQRMKEFLSPRLLDSFVEKTIDALPSGFPSSTPDCAALGRAWKELGLRPGDLVCSACPTAANCCISSSEC